MDDRNRHFALRFGDVILYINADEYSFFHSIDINFRTINYQNVNSHGNDQHMTEIL